MMTEKDKAEFDSSGGKITNGATLRTMLAVRHVLFTANRVLGSEISSGTVSLNEGPGKGQTGVNSVKASARELSGLNPNLRIVVQLSSPCPFIDAACFKNIKGEDVVFPVDLSVFMNSLMFACANQNGLAMTLLELFNFDGVSIRRREVESIKAGPSGEVGGLVGQTFAEAQEWITECILIGVVDPSAPHDRDCGLAPSRSRKLKASDLLIFLDDNSIPTYDPEGPSKAAAARERMKILSQKLNKSAKPILPKENILVCGWRDEWGDDPMRLKKLVLDIAHDLASGSNIVFLNMNTEEAFDAIMEDIDFSKIGKSQYKCLGTTIHHKRGDAGCMDELCEVVMELDFHTSIVLGTQAGIDLDSHSRDTRVLSILLMLRDLHSDKVERLGSSVPHMHVIGENQEDTTSTLALPPKTEQHNTVEPDFINSQAISARVLAQTLAYPHISKAVDEIFTEEEGKATIAFEACEGLIPIDTPIDFATVREFVLDAAEKSRPIVIGVSLSPKHGASVGPIVLPSDDFTMSYGAGDRLIMIKLYESNN